MNDESFDANKSDKNHRAVKLALGLAILSLGFINKKPSGFINLVSKVIGSSFAIYGMTGWDPLAPICNKELWQEKQKEAKKLFASYKSGKSPKQDNDSASENDNMHAAEIR